jgi:hypothetical protein
VSIGYIFFTGILTLFFIIYNKQKQVTTLSNGNLSAPKGCYIPTMGVALRFLDVVSSARDIHQPYDTPALE